MQQLTNPPWAALCSVYLIIYCTFDPNGNVFNLAVPYSYGAVYATVFCLLAFTALDLYGQTGQIGWLLLSAIASGLAGLAKQEFGVAALMAVLIGINLRPTKSFKARIIRSLFVILVAISCVLLPLALLAQRSSWQEIYASLVPVSKTRVLIESGLFSFSPAKTFEVWKGSFYSFIANSLVIGVVVAISQRIANRLRINEQKIRCLTEISIAVLLAWFSLFLLQIPLGVNISKFTIAIALFIVSGLAVVIWKLLKRGERSTNANLTRISIQVLLIIPLVGITIILVRRLGLTFHLLGNLTWILPLQVGWFAIRWRSLIRHQHAVLLWSLLAFSILLYSRFWFSISFYGIYAVTAILLFFTFLYHVAYWTEFPIWNYALVGLLIGGGVNLAKFGEYCYPVSSIYGTMYTNNPGLASAYNQTIRFINDSGSKSVLTIPAGAILNFLTVTHSPSKETFFLPGVLPDAESERNFLAQMQNNPPDLITYVDVPSPWLSKGYQTYAEFNSIVNDWITHQHQLVFTSSKIVTNGREWYIRIYAPNRPNNT
jgi:hypothetical protein